MMDASEPTRPVGGHLSIGALSRATNIPVITLRTWERRYGYPAPMRQASGHRLYDIGTVLRLRRIGEALGRGHRAGQVVPADDQTLDQLLSVTPAARPRPPKRAEDPELLDALMAAIRRYDSEAVLRRLDEDLEARDPISFLMATVAPFLERIGQEWARGDLDIRHEHFASQRVWDFLGRMRSQAERSARGPWIVIATLPGEVHVLGLQMASLAMSIAGCRVLNLGDQVPLTELERVVLDSQARVLALSVSAHANPESTVMQLKLLRDHLPAEAIHLVAGGMGAPEGLTGVRTIRQLDELEAWARGLAARAA